MKHGILLVALILAVGLGACTGTKSITHKRWDQHRNTVYLLDITVQNKGLADAGDRLRLALEDRLADSMFLVGEDPKQAKYQLKYKITQYKKGNRLRRLATFGIDDDSRAVLDVKIALIGKEGVLGAWQIQTWVRGGFAGGSDKELFTQAADKILKHLKGY